MTGKEFVDAALQLIQSLATWPVAIFALAIIFRSYIRIVIGKVGTLFDRLESAKAKGIEAKFSPQLQELALRAKPGPEAAPENLPAALQRPPAQVIAPEGIAPGTVGIPAIETAAQRWARVRETISANADLRWFVGILDQRINHETTLNLIFGTQLSLLDDLSLWPDGFEVGPDTIQFIKHNIFGGSGSISDWLAFPISRGLIEAVPQRANVYRLSAMGKDFLQYLRWAYSVARPFRAL